VSPSRSQDLNVAVVGAGGSYTPELVSGIAQRSPEQLPIGKLKFVDINRERLEIMAGLCRRILDAVKRSTEITTTTDLSRALDDVDFVVTQIRVGGMQARYLDESIPLRYGVIGQETTGPGGMFKALRTIPVMIEIAEEVARLSPSAMMLNYTNPSGVITQAVLNHSGARLVGLCSSIPELQKMVTDLLREPLGTVETRCVGLNHVGFVHEVRAAGEDVTSRAIEEVTQRLATVSSQLERWCRLAQALGAFPVPGYCDYYFRRSEALRRQQSAGQTRSQQIMEIESEVFREAADPSRSSVPDALAKRGGQGYSAITFAVMEAMIADAPADLAMSVLNRGTVTGLPDDASVEVVCRVDASGAIPLPVGDMPLAFRGLVQAVKAHETLTVEAAVSRRRDIALRALLAHPLVGDLEVAEPLLDELLEAHGLDFS
jgi:6-phospho-beta-glucosidase